MGLVNYSFFSKSLGMLTNIAVIIPTFSGMYSEKDIREIYPEGKKFKTLYVLHGASDDCNFYVRNTGIERYANERGFAVVMPEVLLSSYSDMKHGGKYFTYLSEELPALVEALFPLSKAKEDHYVVGNSMGAQGAMKWALRCPEFFNAAAGMSGVASLEDLGLLKMLEIEEVGFFANSMRNAFGTVEQYINSENDLRYLARKLVDSNGYIPKLYSCCGTEDFTYEGCLKFRDYASEIGLALVYQEGPGGHTWEFWDLWLRRIIEWMGL